MLYMFTGDVKKSLEDIKAEQDKLQEQIVALSLQAVAIKDIEIKKIDVESILESRNIFLSHNYLSFHVTEYSNDYTYCTLDNRLDTPYEQASVFFKEFAKGYEFLGHYNQGYNTICAFGKRRS